MTRSENSLSIKYSLIIPSGNFAITFEGSDKTITNPAMDPRPIVSIAEIKKAPTNVSNK